MPIAHGHTIYVDSPWALTSISQAQFWKHVNLAALRRRHREGDHFGRHLRMGGAGPERQDGQGVHARRDQGRGLGTAEAQPELRRHRHPQGRAAAQLEPRPGIRHHVDGTTANEEPLLVNLVDTWRLRPEAVTKIPNLFLASDYVRTYTDLATMEAANEAARRAVNGILEASGSDAVPCPVWDLHEPEIFAPWRELDVIRYAQGLPWDDTLVRVGLSLAELVDKAIVALESGSEEHDVFETQAARSR